MSALLNLLCRKCNVEMDKTRKALAIIRQSGDIAASKSDIVIILHDLAEFRSRTSTRGLFGCYLVYAELETLLEY